MTATETQHTPGPWEAMDSGLIYAPPMEGDGESILICDVGEIDPSTPDRAANALLIAAAPAMLAALELCADVLAELARLDDGTPSIAALNQARAAIRKATGHG